MSKKVTHSEFVERARAVHGNRFEYVADGWAGTSAKTTVVCPIHGPFQQRAVDHLKGIGCNGCGRESALAANVARGGLDIFIEKARKVHGDRYDYSKVDYKRSAVNVTIICPIHGEFQQTPAMHVQGCDCPKCARNSAALAITDSFEEFVANAQAIHGDKYEYIRIYPRLSEYGGRLMDAVCPKHGQFTTSTSSHLHNGSGCPECKKDTLRTPPEEYFRRVAENHYHKYDYSKSVYETLDSKLTIICPIHGEFEQLALHHYHGNSGCPKCAKKSSRWEDYTKDYLTKNNIKFEQHHKLMLGDKRWFELDFLLPDHNIAIEINGIFWHSELNGKDKNYHITKTNICKSRGIDLIHVFVHENGFDFNKVAGRLDHILKINQQTVFARKCQIKKLGTGEKKGFLDTYHLQGNDHSSIGYGLYYNDELLSVMTFGGLRKSLGSTSEEGGYELLRFAVKFGYSIPGAASRLLKAFEREYKPRSMISYANKSWSTGGLYSNLGFEYTHDSSPSYWYFNVKERGKIHHRFAFAKHQLAKKLENFDETLSEWENMKNNDYDRFWDCGCAVFKKEYK